MHPRSGLYDDELLRTSKARTRLVNNQLKLITEQSIPFFLYYLRLNLRVNTLSLDVADGFT
jgi:hypothetical protein